MTARDLHALLHSAADADPRPDAELLLAAGDAAGMTGLVRRHGPLVWAVCRRSLPEADAADAFQAVFLALHRSRGRIRNPAAVAGWLHAAAVRVCLKQRRDAARRRGRERRAARPEATTPVADSAWETTLLAAHEEVGRLPEGERLAFVLCDLQGVPQAEAAVRLGWKPGTLTGRLSKARARLLTRLSARGLAPGLGAVGVLTVPAEVATAASGCVGPAASVSPAVLLLSREVTAMLSVKHLAAAALVAGGVLAGAGGLAQRANSPGGDGGLPPPKPTAPEQKPAAPPKPGIVLSETYWDYTVIAPKWEHATVPKPATVAEFDKLLIERGRDGWEFAGVVTLAEPAAGNPGGGMGGPGREGGGPVGGMPGGGPPGMGGGQMRSVERVVFKRPAGGPPDPRALHVVPQSAPPSPDADRFGGNPPDAELIWGFISKGQPTINLNDPANRRLKDRMERDGTPIPADGVLTKELLKATLAARAGTASPVPPAAVNLRTEVFKLRNAAADDLARVLQAVVPAGSFVAPSPVSNTLTVAVPGVVFPAVERLIRELDVLPVRPPSAPLPAPKPADGPGTVGGFVAVPLTHAKAADVARTVRELFPEPKHVGGGPGFTAPQPAGLAISADDRRNLVLFRATGYAGGPTEEQVRKLVADLDVPGSK